MEIADRIIDYLKETYQPEAIIAYGSFADGSANSNSDFDALVIAGKGRGIYVWQRYPTFQEPNG